MPDAAARWCSARMRRRLPLLAVCALVTSSTACPTTSKDDGAEGEGEGEDAAVFDFPDPVVVNARALDPTSTVAFVGFATNNEAGNVPMAVADDIEGPWRLDGDALPELPVWAEADAGLTWAPAVLKRGDHYVLFFTARDLDSGFQCIGAATSTTLRGPYVDDTLDPIVCQVVAPEALCGSIDPSIFHDDADDEGDGGTDWLLWKSDENAPECQGDSRLWSQRLDDDDGTTVVGDRHLLLTHDAAWEAPLIEGPALVADDDGDLVLFYSANRWETDDYATGYARCPSPEGPCVKVTTDGPWLHSARGPGGPEVVVDDVGALWLTFHAWTASGGLEGGGVRMLDAQPLDLEALP